MFNKEWTPETLSDILNTNLDYQLIGEPNMLYFNGNNSVTLYVGLNKTNAEKLSKHQYTDVLIAHEYYDIAKTIKQAEVIVKIAYNTEKLFDMLHPNAYEQIDKFIKARKLNKKDLKDLQLIREILHTSNYTGVRVPYIQGNKKGYTSTEMVYEKSQIVYYLKPQNISILGVYTIN